MGGGEPSVETGRMEFVLAGLACKPWQTVIGRMDDTVADGAFFHSFEFSL